MLDRKFIVENAEAVQANCANRGVVADVARFVQLETERKARQAEIERLNRRANEVAKSIGQAADPAEREARREEGRRLREEVADVKAEVDEIEVEQASIQTAIPNMTHPDAPVGGDEEANREIAQGKTPPRAFDFKPLDHVELGERLDL
ncbi:MAG: serine--tRNA ligase, partial [Pirellulales bacterium]|nr:serine--tRNA ligase [Pirellulales bacterium]